LSSSHEKFIEEKDALDVFKFAFDNGVTFFDSSDLYGIKHSNEELLGVVGPHLQGFKFIDDPHIVFLSVL